MTLIPIRYGIERHKPLGYESAVTLHQVRDLGDGCIYIHPFLEVSRGLPGLSTVSDRPGYLDENRTPRLSPFSIATQLQKVLNLEQNGLDEGFPEVTISNARKGSNLLLNQYRVGLVYRRTAAYRLMDFLKGNQ